MEINGKRIADFIGTLLKKELTIKKKVGKPKMVVFLIGDSSDQQSFVKIKSQIAKNLGIEYEIIHIKTVPSFESFVHNIKEKSMDPATTAIIIQQPLPAQLGTESLFDYIAIDKEIEGHRRKTTYFSPIGLAVLTILKYIYGNQKLDKNLLIDIEKDRTFFKKTFRNKKVVLVGRGVTGGIPIGKTLSEVKINYISINSTTPQPETYLKEADIIVSAVGKKVILPEHLKSGVVLINVGVRKEGGKLLGDFDEKEIKNIAGYYTSAPGGVSPIDVMYLYRNLIAAYKKQR